MSRLATLAYVLAMVALIVGVDIAFMRHHFWLRLATNIAIVAAFGAFWLLVLRQRPGGA